MSPPEMITLGKVSGVFGVKGWVKVFSYTEQREGILDYNPWFLKLGGEWKAFSLQSGQVQGKGIIASLEGVVQREQAEALVGCSIAIPRGQLQELRKGEYYWADLEGMKVVTVDGVELGSVDALFETGSNDVLVVRGDRERLVPWIMGDVIRSVSVEDKHILVAWDPDF